jgi:hypothetical protein
MIQLLSLIITVNLLFAAFMYMWATDDDISNLHKGPCIFGSLTTRDVYYCREADFGECLKTRI